MLNQSGGFRVASAACCSVFLTSCIFPSASPGKPLSLSAEQRLRLRQRVSARLLGKPHQYSGGTAAGGSAEESIRRSGALCAESVGGLTRFLGTASWRSTTAPRNGPTATSAWAGATGPSSAATPVVRPRRCCEALLPPASGAVSSRLPGFGMCSRGFCGHCQRFHEALNCDCDRRFRVE
jgi:hypothetical protein